MAVYGRLRRLRTDWFRVLADLQLAGMPNLHVARAIAVPETTLRHWKQGGEPGHEDGHLLLQLWCQRTGHDIEQRPMCTRWPGGGD